MKKITLRKITFLPALVVFAFLYTVSLAGCTNALSGLPDFSITTPVFNNQEVSFVFYNSAAWEIQKIHIKMNVYDKKTGCPPANNVVTFECGFDCSIPPFENQLLYASLTDYLQGTQSDQLVIDNFYISRLLFSNGKEWRDVFGFYSQFYLCKEE